MQKNPQRASGESSFSQLRSASDVKECRRW